MTLIERPRPPARNTRRVTGGNSASDQIAALSDAVTQVSAVGGGTVEFEGNVGISELLAVPNGVTVVGAGHGRTAGKKGSVLTCLTPTAQLRFEAAAHYGGVSGNFIVDGANLATDPLYVGLAAGRRFESIYVERAAAGGAAFKVASAQNCNFENIKLETNAGDGLVFDLGAGNNSFYDLGVADTTGNAVKFVQSGASPAGVHASPSGNKIDGFVIEGIALNAGNLVYHGAGQMNRFIAGNFGLGNVDVARAIVTMRVDGAQPSDTLLLENVWWVGNQTHTTMIDLAANTNCALVGNHSATGFLRVFFAADNSRVHDHAHWEGLGSITDWFVSPTSTAFAENSIVRHRMRAPIEITRRAISDTAIAVTTDAGGTVPWAMDANGGMVWTADTNLYRAAANHLKTDDKMQVVGELELDGALNHDGANVGLRGVAPVAISAAYTPTNVTTDRSYDADTVLPAELADVLGTLIADLQAQGIIG